MSPGFTFLSSETWTEIVNRSRNGPVPVLDEALGGNRAQRLAEFVC